MLLAFEEGAVKVDDVLLLVFMTRGLFVKSNAELPVRTGRGAGAKKDAERLRRWRSGPVDKVYEVAVALHHDYVGSAANQADGVSEN